ncbi:hypothetical protein B0H11DRAFT_2305378 [Mycena galericulata]|nr:hypothetical protein B0H11DRAFT_2305378 [Mycena galericulata]
MLLFYPRRLPCKAFLVSAPSTDGAHNADAGMDLINSSTSATHLHDRPNDDLADCHYNGYSNSILWPLFHYHPNEMNFDKENWLASTPGAMVWVQDYHLMLLPMLLRGLLNVPGVKIRFFLHTPFLSFTSNPPFPSSTCIPFPDAAAVEATSASASASTSPPSPHPLHCYPSYSCSTRNSFGRFRSSW